MKNKNCRSICLLFIALVALSYVALGQHAADNKVRNFNVRFQPGSNQAVIRGKADFDMSYVYNFKVRKGQKIDVEVDSTEKDLTFDVVLKRVLGDNLRQWSGSALLSGTYSVVLKWKNEDATNVAVTIPYSLRIKIV